MKYIIIVLVLIAGHFSYAQCDSNIVVNGSFTSAEGTDITALGWTAISTPDINDEFDSLNSTEGYNWTGTPLASPSGGTWQNMFDSESISQTVSLVSGQEYSMCFEYAAQGITFNPQFTYDDPVGIDVFIDGVLAYTAADDQSQYTWETACYVFTAEFSNTVIEFSASQIAYVAIDGVCLNLGGTNSIKNDLASESELSISPNPFATSTRIEFSNPLNKPYLFTLYDSQGRVARAAANITREQITVERNDMAEGIYFFQLSSEVDGVSYGGRLIMK